MNARDKIAADLGRYGSLDSWSVESLAEAVVAAIRAMTPSEQAELLQGEVQTWHPGHLTTLRQRATGPWREVES